MLHGAVMAINFSCFNSLTVVKLMSSILVFSECLKIPNMHRYLYRVVIVRGIITLTVTTIYRLIATPAVIGSLFFRCSSSSSLSRKSRRTCDGSCWKANKRNGFEFFHVSLSLWQMYYWASTQEIVIKRRNKGNMRGNIKRVPGRVLSKSLCFGLFMRLLFDHPPTDQNKYRWIGIKINKQVGLAGLDLNYINWIKAGDAFRFKEVTALN